MVRGVYWNIKFVSQPWWCIFSRCLTHVLGRVPLHQPPIMFSSWVWVEPRSARRRKPETSIPVHWSTQKQTKCKNLPSKHCYHCRVQAQTSQTLPVTLSRSALEGIQIHGLLDMDFRYGQRPVQWAGASLCPLQRSEKEKNAPSWLPMFFFLIFLFNLFLYEIITWTEIFFETGCGSTSRSEIFYGDKSGSS